MHPLHRKVAKAVHLSIYFTLILLPLSGLAIAALVQQGRTSGLLPDLAVGLHELAASLSYLLILIHVTAAIYSRIKGVRYIVLHGSDLERKSTLEPSFSI